ncbi:unnamed protein product [Polarella glacialis]|uniref:Uncharacterized protein n=1 Tax=Polarella glacialis TaxID=89957 RepID=A0A813DHN2_POLGL|nr:unnamed protein product [Polarella glacialis]
MLSLPAPMSASASTRHFLHIATSRDKVKEPEHRRDFKLPFSSVEPLLKAALDGNLGAILVDALGREAVLSELTVIRSELGAASQEWHSDSNWGATEPRRCTFFFALHDILEEDMGPSYFCPNTHAPRCFPDERWIPPAAALVENRPSVWFALHAGDAVLFDAFTWHKGGANTGKSTRTILAVTFLGGEGASGEIRLGDFVSA